MLDLVRRIVKVVFDMKIKGLVHGHPHVLDSYHLSFHRIIVYGTRKEVVIVDLVNSLDKKEYDSNEKTVDNDMISR